MLSQRCQRYRSFLKPPKCTDVLKESASGSLSPDTMVTTSSGYSTGSSSVSTTTIRSSKKSPSLVTHKQHQEQQKTKSKGFHNLITKLKSFIISPKTKLIHSSTMIPTTSTNIHRKYSPPYTLASSSSSIKTSNTISLPFTYYHNSPRKCQSYTIKTTNFDKISAWLDHTETIKLDDNELSFIDDTQQQSISSSSSSFDIDNQVTLIMKKSPLSIKTPKRSTSMVSTMTRPIIEQKQYDRTVSPTASFSSSILTRGMSELMTPQKIYHQSGTNLSREQSNNLLPKSNRRRVIDFSRRRTVAGPTEQINNNNNNNNNNNKENVPNNRREQIYQFSPSTKKYYFHSTTPMKTEDMLMNSYGLTLLKQQQQPVQQRHAVSAVVMMSQCPDNSSQKQLKRRTSIQVPQQQTIDSSLDDLLCDREVESYFYPNRQQSPTSLPQHIYINLETSSNYYQPPPYIHGTLC